LRNANDSEDLTYLAPGHGVSELNPLAEVRQARMAGIIWDEGFARVTDLAGGSGCRRSRSGPT
jgi:hypothetical protein